MLKHVTVVLLLATLLSPPLLQSRNLSAQEAREPRGDVKEQNSAVAVGAFGGVNLGDLSGDAPAGASFVSSTGFAAGLLGEFRVASDVWLSLQPMYIQKGSDLRFKPTRFGQADTLGLTLDYVTLPILLKIVSGNGKTYVSGGVDAGYLVNATLSNESESRDVVDSFNKIDLSADFAFGVMLPIGRPKVTLEARYSQSILNVAKEGQNPEEEALPARFRSSGLQLYAGLLYPLGRRPAGASQGGERSTSQVAQASEFKRPLLGGHAFLPNNLVPDPFIKTFIRNSVGLGQAVDLEIPLPLIDGDTIVGLKGDLLFAILDFEYQHAVKDWLAVRGEVGVVGRLGTDLGALFASGVTAATGFNLGWLIRLFESERTLLSGSLQLSSNNFTTINISRFVEDIIQGRPASLVGNTPIARGGGSLRFAWGQSQFFGLTAQAAGGYGESVERTADDQLYVDFGGTLDFDLLAISPVPIGVLLGFKLATFPEAGDDVKDDTRTVLLRIAYNGRSDFIIGLDVRSQQFESRTLNQTINFGSFGISLRYYF